MKKSQRLLVTSTLSTVLGVIGFGLAGFGTLAQAASYDCNKARLATEKTICANRGLNDRDVKMATTFNIMSHAVPMGGRDHLIGEQVLWLKQRNGCGSNVACIANAYQNRQKQLDQMLQDRVLSYGPF